MNILAIDTATEVMGICLDRTDGKRINLSSRMGLQHATGLLPWIDQILEKGGTGIKKIGLMVCSIGPGSFTGLRIGLSTAKGLAMGNNVPLVGISTLEALAHGLRFFPGLVVPVIDAKKKRIYTALFRGGERLSEDADMEPEKLIEKIRDSGPILLTGPMAPRVAALCKGALVNPGHSEACAHILAELGSEKYRTEGAGPDTLSPVYLRKSEAELKMFGE